MICNFFNFINTSVISWRVLLTVYIAASLPLCNGWTVKEKCESCVDINKSFLKGMKETSRANFGGGNTAWEESRLGSFKYSETRLVSILEKVCSDGNRHKDTCNELVEENEEAIEKWWAMKRKGTDKDVSLHDFLCINELKVCCKPLHFGADCKQCPGLVSNKPDGSGKKLACNGHGECDGEGMRSGNGKCSCDDGYEGDFCSMCSDDHFNNSTKNGTVAVCEKCHSACDGGCSGRTPEDCTSGCSSGWEWKPSTDNTTGTCVDVDECANATLNDCTEREYCVNEPGSHSCPSCHVTCSTCRGPNPENCTACSVGYQFKGTENGTGLCEDINECANHTDDNPVCTNGKVCTNTPGSYDCSCPPGMHENAEGVCEETKEETPPPVQSEEPKSEESSEEKEEQKESGESTKHEEL